MILFFRHWCNFQIQRPPLLRRMPSMEEASLGDNCFNCLTFFFQLLWTIWLLRGAHAFRLVTIRPLDNICGISDLSDSKWTLSFCCLVSKICHWTCGKYWLDVFFQLDHSLCRKCAKLDLWMVDPSTFMCSTDRAMHFIYLFCCQLCLHYDLLKFFVLVSGIFFLSMWDHVLLGSHILHTQIWAWNSRATGAGIPVSYYKH